MSPQALWKDIATELANEIALGHFVSGDKLPTESHLSQRFGVHRHTVRKALSALAEQQLVWSKRGSGVFVTGQKTPYPIGKRVRFHQNISASGRTPSRDVLQILTRPANSQEADALQIKAGGPVHVFYGVSKSDNVPLALFHSIFDATRFQKLDQYLYRYHSVTRALNSCGLPDYTRAWTHITSLRATSLQANLLQISAGDPLLCTTSLNCDLKGQPIEHGRTHFVGDRVQISYP